MGLITAAIAYKTIDKLVAGWLALRGTSGSGFGAGDGTYGVSKKMDDIRKLVEGSADATFADGDLQVVWLASARNLEASFETEILFNQARNFVSDMATLCSQAKSVSDTIADVDSFLLYYNTVAATKWQCLTPPEWVDIYTSLKGSAPNHLNVYFEVLEGGTFEGTTFTNALHKQVIAASVPTDTVGDIIDRTKYAGGRPYIKWTGGNGAGAVSITVVGKNQAGATVNYTKTGTWGVGDFVADGSAGFTLTPSVADSLITEVTTVTITGISDGTFYIEARRPSGRTYPPT